MNSQRSKVNKLWIIKTKVPNESNIAKYLTEKKIYAKNIRKAKRKSWRDFMDSIVDPNGMALLANITKKGPEQKLGLLKKSDGTYYKMNPFVHHVP